MEVRMKHLLVLLQSFATIHYGLHVNINGLKKKHNSIYMSLCPSSDEFQSSETAGCFCVASLEFEICRFLSARSLCHVTEKP